MSQGIAHAGAVASSPYANDRPSVWINGPRWDLSWLVGTALVVPVGLVVIAMGAPADAVNLWVTVLVGGPHLFATYLATYMDPKFRRAHWPALIAVTLLVPGAVVAMTFWDFQVLLSFFIFAASLHVLQQNAYLADVYVLPGAQRRWRSSASCGRRRWPWRASAAASRAWPWPSRESAASRASWCTA